MDLNEIKALMDRFDTSACTVLELEEGNLRLRLEKGTAPVSVAPEIQAAPAAPGAAAPQPAPAEEGQTLNAPLVGTFYAAPAPGEAPFVKAGDQVRKGQTVCVLEAMKMDLGQEVKRLKADGGASANNYLLQTQADLTGVQVDRPACVETTAMGAAYLAGLAVGFWKNKEEIARGWKADRSFFPKIEEEVRCRMLKGWQKAVRCSYGWAKDGI